MRASYGRCKKKCDTCWRRAFHVRRSWRVDSRAPWHDTRFLFIDKVCTKESSAGIKTVMKFKKVEPEQFDCTKTTMRPFGCMELWAGNEKAHRSLDLAGLQSDVIAVPSGAHKGADLSALFSCTHNIAPVFLSNSAS